jgi:hypothetical protein
VYYYILGNQPVQHGDRIRVTPNRMATVSTILEPLSDDAKSYDQPDGGVILDFDDGDCWLVQDFHEDFELINRVTLVR